MAASPTHRIRFRLFLSLFIALVIVFPLAVVLRSDDPLIQQSTCMVRHTSREMIACILDSTCRSLVQCMGTCSDPTSPRRIRALEQNQHLQHPESPLPCTVGCMDDYDNEVVDEFLSAFMSHGCAADSQLVDTCVGVDAKRPFAGDPEEFDMSFLVGEWQSIRTGGWDHWDCQKKIFFSPDEGEAGAPYHSTFWATYRTYPKSRDGAPKDNVVFEEIYPNVDEADGPTWRTRFTMWGTDSSEEWHVIDFSRGDEATGEPAWVIAEVCIETPSIHHMDVFTIVLSKAANVSQELSEKIDSIVMDKVGYPLKSVNNDVCDPSPDYERKR
ncbi:MAG: hypothetical protein JRG80_16760 [Deltaproteobacteria bacterium]|nr:hypothetical protein [Deltaproteobacteria bacterium]MBW2400896.1 hypothetical protein [Deltaproteobacteria bacterium]